MPASMLSFLVIILNPCHHYKSFECPSVTLNLPSSTLTVFNIYLTFVKARVRECDLFCLTQNSSLVKTAATIDILVFLETICFGDVLDGVI